MSNANLYSLFLEHFPDDVNALFLDDMDGRRLRCLSDWNTKAAE